MSKRIDFYSNRFDMNILCSKQRKWISIKNCVHCVFSKQLSILLVPKIGITKKICRNLYWILCHIPYIYVLLKRKCGSDSFMFNVHVSCIANGNEDVANSNCITIICRPFNVRHDVINNLEAVKDISEKKSKTQMHQHHHHHHNFKPTNKPIMVNAWSWVSHKICSIWAPFNIITENRVHTYSVHISEWIEFFFSVSQLTTPNFMPKEKH